MPSDPRIDEDAILDMLKADVEKGGAETLEHAGLFAVVDAFDRKSTRDEFMTALSAGMHLHSLCTKYKLLLQIMSHHASSSLDAALLESTRSYLAGLIRTHQGDTVKMVERLKECPTLIDKVH